MKIFLLTSLLILVSSFSQAEESVGKVILSFGQNVAVSTAGDERALKRQADVFANDLLKTSAKGRLQIRFTDGSRLSLKPNTEFKIDDYRFDEANPEDGKAIYKLLKGGMRTISGKIGKVDKEDYKLDAVVATIGIRGTDFSVDKAGERVTGSVSQGKINVAAKQGGSRDIASGRSFSLVGPRGSINVFKTPASTGATEENAESSEPEESSEEDTEQQEDTATEADDDSSETESDQEAAQTSGNDDSSESGATLDLSTTVATTSNSIDSTIPASDPVAESNDQNIIQEVTTTAPNPTGSGTAAPMGSLVAVAFTEIDSVKGLNGSSGRVFVDGQSAITVDSTQGTGDLVTGLVYFDSNTSPDNDCTPCSFTGPSTVARLLDNNTKELGGANVTWGRWGNDYTVIENSSEVETVGSFHFMYTDGLTPASVVTAKTGDYVYRLDSYVSAGGYTKPEIETGATGTLKDFVGGGGTGGHIYSGTYFRVDFDSQKLLEIGIEANVAGRNYALREDANANMNLNNILSGNDVKLTGTCTGGDCGANTDMSGRMTIDFVGEAAQGAVTSYGATGENASNGTTGTISGTILLEAQQSP
ncbi:FecR domain-containing protein [Neptuniibacter sp. PT8_73]|uniref:FecR domain-containing protein n=1 Tax=unclassified Neptuniibacter TaxID=2630693 RepID=UPI0039F67D44